MTGSANLRKPNWDRLRELGLKLSEDDLHDLEECFEHFYDPCPIGRRPILERYIERETCIHVHLRYIRPSQLGPDHPSEFCVVFEWPLSQFLTTLRVR